MLIAGALTAAVCVGLAALTGSRGTVIGLALAFQLGVSPILAQVEAIGDFRYGIPSVAIARIGGAASSSSRSPPRSPSCWPGPPPRWRPAPGGRATQEI